MPQEKLTEACGKPLHPVRRKWILCHDSTNPFLAPVRVNYLRMRHELYLSGLEMGGVQPAS